MSEILESVLQTVQKQFTYRQYSTYLQTYRERQCANKHIHILSTHSVLFKTLSFPVAQLVEHGVSNAKIMGSIPRESKS